MNYLGEQLVNGLCLGTVYVLLAIGFNMVYGVLRLLNFAHSEVFMSGTFLSFLGLRLVEKMGWPPLLAVVVVALGAGLGCGLIALIIERVGYRPILDQPKVTSLITAIGFSALLQNIFIRLFGAETRAFPSLELPMPPRGVAFLLASLATLFFYLLVQKADIGIQMRAVSENSRVAQLFGVNPGHISRFAFFFGGVLAAIGGMTWGLLYGTVNPQMGFLPGIKAFIIAVVGSIGNIWGSLVVGIGLGVAEALIAAYLPSDVSGHRDSVAFLLLIVVLVIRPNGLFGSVESPKV